MVKPAPLEAGLCLYLVAGICQAYVVCRTRKADHVRFACILRPAFTNREDPDIAGPPPRYYIFKAPNKRASVAYPHLVTRYLGDGR